MFKCGIENIDQYLHLFEGKRVGLITNPTGVNNDLVSTVDILNSKTNLVALFSPEHGVRGDLQAGVKLDDYVDPKTGIKVYSLYGKNKKPNKEMMDSIDVLVFDIQDVGARFYTFIYTMAYAMMACAEHDKDMIVLDRPNPVNGIDVEGNILNTHYRSFVGYYPITQRYGLTIGELANFFNKEYDINARVHVVKMEEYDRRKDISDLPLSWVMPSPNIPTVETAYHYLGTCIFEGTTLSEGRGTTKPFHIIGSPYLDTDYILEALKRYDIKGVKFRSVYFTPTFSKHKGELCSGIELIMTDKALYSPVRTALILLDIIKKHHPEFGYIPPWSKGGHMFIDLISGDDYVRNDSLSLEEQLEKIQKDSQEFITVKRRYHLYE